MVLLPLAWPALPAGTSVLMVCSAPQADAPECTFVTPTSLKTEPKLPDLQVLQGPHRKAQSHRWLPATTQLQEPPLRFRNAASAPTSRCLTIPTLLSWDLGLWEEGLAGNHNRLLNRGDLPCHPPHPVVNRQGC